MLSVVNVVEPKHHQSDDRVNRFATRCQWHEILLSLPPIATKCARWFRVDVDHHHRRTPQKCWKILKIFPHCGSRLLSAWQWLWQHSKKKWNSHKKVKTKILEKIAHLRILTIPLYQLINIIMMIMIGERNSSSSSRAHLYKRQESKLRWKHSHMFSFADWWKQCASRGSHRSSRSISYSVENEECLRARMRFFLRSSEFFVSSSTHLGIQ